MTTPITIIGALGADPEIRRRFYSKVKLGSGAECWPWTAGKISSGYGAFHPGHGKTVLAHRFSYELTVGPIPDGLVIDHTCRNRDCVNPSHLEPVTNEENLRRGAGYALRNGMRSSCKNGHQYTQENTYTDPRGGIRCRECARIRDRQPHRNSTIRRHAPKGN